MNACIYRQYVYVRRIVYCVHMHHSPSALFYRSIEYALYLRTPVSICIHPGADLIKGKDYPQVLRSLVALRDIITGKRVPGSKQASPQSTPQKEGEGEETKAGEESNDNEHDHDKDNGADAFYKRNRDILNTLRDSIASGQQEQASSFLSSLALLSPSKTNTNTNTGSGSGVGLSISYGDDNALNTSTSSVTSDALSVSMSGDACEGVTKAALLTMTAPVKVCARVYDLCVCNVVLWSTMYCTMY